MKDEICAAVNFLIKLISSNNSQLSQVQTQELQNSLTDLLSTKFQNHWHPDKPSKGQAFRCIRLNGMNRNDSVLEAACKRSGLSYEELKFPIELTLWIDPEEVTARFGEHRGSYCILAKFKGGNKENFLSQINVTELEQKSMERSHQASLDIMLNRKKKYNKSIAFAKTNSVVPNWNNTGVFEMCSPQANGNANFYNGYYATSPKYFSSSPPQQTPVVSNGGMYSPSRMSPYRNMSTVQASFATGGLNSKFMVRNFNNSLMNVSPGGGQLMYEQNATFAYQADRYHWMNKSIVKA